MRWRSDAEVQRERRVLRAAHEFEAALVDLGRAITPPVVAAMDDLERAFARAQRRMARDARRARWRRRWMPWSR